MNNRNTILITKKTETKKIRQSKPFKSNLESHTTTNPRVFIINCIDELLTKINPRATYGSYNNSMDNKKIGELLKEAHIIDENQLNLALIQQQIYSQVKIGNILAFQGWLKQKTADFFASEIKTINKEKGLLIGTIFLKAGLLSEDEIKNILKKQKQIDLRFGEIAIQEGLLKKETVDFFIKHLALSKNDKDFSEHKMKKILNLFNSNTVNKNNQKIQTNKKTPYLYSPYLDRLEQFIDSPYLYSPYLYSPFIEQFNQATKTNYQVDKLK